MAGKIAETAASKADVSMVKILNTGVNDEGLAGKVSASAGAATDARVSGAPLAGAFNH